MERELRKSQNILVVLGYGVIMFGAWSLFKSILTCTLDFGLVLRSPDDDVIVYGCGLLVTGIMRIVNSFRRTAIVYIQ